MWWYEVCWICCFDNCEFDLILLFGKKLIFIVIVFFFGGDVYFGRWVIWFGWSVVFMCYWGFCIVLWFVGFYMIKWVICVWFDGFFGLS